MKKILFGFAVTFLYINVYSQNYGNGVTDIDGNDYISVVIGNQEWMASNLKSTKYANGEPIPNIIDSALWANQSSGAWSYFQNNADYDSLYGKLYNGYAVQDNRNVCPVNWRVSSKSDWVHLVDYLGTDSAGSKLKSIGTDFWIAPNQDATNETGFSGYPSGSRFINGGFPTSIMSPYAVWATATLEGSWQSWYADLHHVFGDVQYGLGGMKGGLAIRCIKSTQLTVPNNLGKKDFSIFPNPSQNEIRIQYSENNNELNFKIFDSRGVVILSGPLTNEKIDISSLETGVYYIEISKTGTSLGNAKILKL